jgi:hypothetical protein
VRSITEAKAKTDRLDARTLARLLASGLLDQVWTPDERTRALRRLTNRRERLVRARTRAKNEAHGVLARNLCERAPVTDTFGKAGRRWLAGLELPLDERLTLDGCLRQVDFLETEIAALDAEIAKQALAWPEVLRLMSVPGVNVQTAATFMAAIGDIGRFSSPRKLVSYLGLDPRVRGGRGDRNGPQAHRALLAPTQPRGGVRLRATGDDAQQDPAARVARRRPVAERPARNRRRQIESGLRRRTRALPASRSRLPAPRQRLALNRTGESGCGRDKGARIFSALEGQSRAADSVSPNGLRFARSITRTQPKGSHQPRRPST